MTAALLHALNHSLFKSLLFFGAGAVLTATGARDMERARRPHPPHAGDRPASCWSAASAISALPPLNGFVSEWLILQAVLLGPQLPQWTLKLLAPTVGAVLALTAALAAACFVRLFGITFLGRPRSRRRGRRARGRPLLAGRDGRARAALPARGRSSRA